MFILLRWVHGSAVAALRQVSAKQAEGLPGNLSQRRAQPAATADVPPMQAPTLVEETLQEALELSRQLQQALCDQPSCTLSQSIQTAESFGAVAILLQSFRDSHSRGYGTVVWGKYLLQC